MKHYTFLGFKLGNNGNFKHVINDRMAKASRVANMVLQALKSTGNINIKVSLSIFEYIN